MASTDTDPRLPPRTPSPTYPVVYPGNPLCHLLHLDDRTLRAIERNEG